MKVDETSQPLTAGTAYANKYVVLDADKNFSGIQGIAFGATPTTHPINFAGMTLATSTNAIRGASLNPTRTSGWTSFSGTISTTPASCYTDYRELHTTGVAEVLGAGFFPYMDATASCASMYAIQAISFLSSGSTLLTAAAAPGIGAYAIWAKTVIDSGTFNSGAQIGAAFLSVQANVTTISGGISNIIYMECASGLLKDVLYLKATGGVFATNFMTLSANTAPVSAWGATAVNCSCAPDKGMRIVAGTDVYWIPLYVKS
jgi:hypothetical protein